MSTLKGNGATSQGRGRRSSAGGPAPSPAARGTGALGTAIDRVAADLRALVVIARSAALPPAGRLDAIEREARRHIEDLRARLGVGGEAVSVEGEELS